jgi:hypothetical protein
MENSRMKKRPVGRPRNPDRKEHIPNITIRKSLKIKMIKLARKTDFSLSQHFENAVRDYLESVN